MKKHTPINQCPITGHDEQIKYFDLGDIPLVNNLCETRNEALNAERFPLNINYYPASGESSLSIAIDGELLFSHYLFKSEVNKPYYKHCQEMFRYVQEYVKVKDETQIIDIGGNDGSLLDISKKADVVTSTNVFQHLFDINSFAKGVECLLNENGIWVLEFPYWIHDMKTNQFDQIYHEHMFYHSVTPMKMMMEKHGMKIINVTKQNIHGGTLRLVIAKKDAKHTSDITVEAYLQLEKNYGLDYHVKWGKEVQQHIIDSKNFIKQLKSESKTIYGFGAAAKGCIYMNAMNLTYEDIDCIIDDTDLKQGKYILWNRNSSCK
jgi:hypothetical protein